ncbi:MAG TPA: hypothetical protein PLG90_09680 [Ignavibacteria bacterium]|nr:hypothetical protein [Ignavibacteria bacterium]
MKKLILTLALVVTSVFGLTSSNSYANPNNPNNCITITTDQNIIVYRNCGNVTLKFTYELDLRLVKVEIVED